MKVEKVLLGMHRPKREEVQEMIINRGISLSYFWCRCFPPEIAAHLGSFESHYQSGHYDEPVYKYIWEQDGKIIESLMEPPK